MLLSACDEVHQERSDQSLPNQPPTLSTLLISPENPTTSQFLRCDATALDRDGDELSIHYEWTGASGQSLSVTPELTLTPERFRPRDVISCTATVSDGVVTVSDTITTTSVNTPPVIDRIHIDHANTDIRVNSMLTCTAHVSDLDWVDRLTRLTR